MVKIMKRLLLLLLIFFVVPLGANAISGACSYHGGVNCSAGGTFDGKVICNDGWINSSVYFSDTDECRISPPHEVYLPPPSCSISDIQSQCDRTMASVRGLQVSGGNMGTPAAEAAISQAAQECNRQINACNAQINAYNQYQQLVQQQKQEDIKWRAQIDAWKNQDLIKQQKDSDTLDSNLASNIAYCVNVHGSHSVFNEASRFCGCASGYGMGDKGQCEDLNTTCAERRGINSIWDPKIQSCACRENYTLQSGICAQKQTKNISLNAKNWVDYSSGTCVNDPLLSQNEIAQCVDYQLHKNDYDWQIDTASNAGVQNISSNPPVQSSPAKINTTTTSTVTLTKDLKMGDSGDQVIRLQKFLERKGLLSFPSGAKEGYFGSLTKRALIVFQKSVGLAPTGYCGTMTRKAIASQSF